MNLRHGELGRLVRRCRYLRNLGMWDLKSLNLGNGELRGGNDFGLNGGQGKLRCLDLRGDYLGRLGSLMRLTLGHLRRLLPGHHSGVLDGWERSRDRSRQRGQAGRLLDRRWSLGSPGLGWSWSPLFRQNWHRGRGGGRRYRGDHGVGRSGVKWSPNGCLYLGSCRRGGCSDLRPADDGSRDGGQSRGGDGDVHRRRGEDLGGARCSHGCDGRKGGADSLYKVLGWSENLVCDLERGSRRRRQRRGRGLNHTRGGSADELRAGG